jgi:hypothetical protein
VGKILKNVVVQIAVAAGPVDAESKPRLGPEIGTLITDLCDQGAGQLVTILHTRGRSLVRVLSELEGPPEKRIHASLSQGIDSEHGAAERVYLDVPEQAGDLGGVAGIGIADEEGAHLGILQQHPSRRRPVETAEDYAVVGSVCLVVDDEDTRGGLCDEQM